MDSSHKYLITFVIPAYNAQRHLRTSIPSILNDTSLEENILKYFEVIIVNDGSKDKTLEVAQEFANKWNGIQEDVIKIIDKPNGQYGSTINAALKIAQGKYFKVLDADDWFNVEAFVDLVYILKNFEKDVDVIFTEHVYEKVKSNKQTQSSLWKYFEQNKIMPIQEAKFPKDLITMHSIIYRTQLLWDINYVQIEDYYYTDSQYSLVPLCFAKNMYYTKLPLYRYYIGRADQSINMEVMIRNREHQLVVLQRLLEQIDIDKIESKSVRKYTFISLRRMVQWQMLLIILDKSVDKKYPEVKNLLNILHNIQKVNNSRILKGAFFTMFKITKGFFIKGFLQFAFKIYSKFKLSLMDGS